MDIDIINALQPLIKKRMEISLIKIKNDNPDYKESMENLISLDREYESLNLDEQTRMFIDRLLEAHDDEHGNETYLSYMAGMRDCIIILQELGLLEL